LPQALAAMLKATQVALVDKRYAGPVKISGKVLSVVKGDQQAEIEAVVQVGSIRVIVTKIRQIIPYRCQTLHGLALICTKPDIVVVKLGYLDPDLYNAKPIGCWRLRPGGRIRIWRI
jgi:microcystin degradation protein MlrC